MTISTLLASDVHSADPDPFAGLPTVGLAELNSLAALQTRVDRKYLLTAADLDGLFANLQATARVLDIDGRRRSGYTSTYFDTDTFDTYLAAARSRPNRFKVRVRSYLDTDAHYLEVKTRSRLRHTMKTRCPATAHDHLELSASGRQFVLETLDEQLPTRRAPGHALAVAALGPTLSTHYQRTTLLVEPTAHQTDLVPMPSRATIDTSLAFSAPGRERISYPGVAVIETKTTGAPSPIDRLLWQAGHRPTKVSKFGVGVALFNPELPATKWNRILRRDFAWAPR